MEASCFRSPTNIKVDTPSPGIGDTNAGFLQGFPIFLIQYKQGGSPEKFRAIFQHLSGPRQTQASAASKQIKRDFCCRLSFFLAFAHQRLVNLQLFSKRSSLRMQLLSTFSVFPTTYQTQPFKLCAGKIPSHMQFQAFLLIFMSGQTLNAKPRLIVLIYNDTPQPVDHKMCVSVAPHLPP